ncbi:MAG TPA: glycosyltransferase 87 family protein [Gaiellaceae bacterium]|nr:glycosyltransferase 87 family protein [Gaiellaceae bacterium]
MTDVGTPGGLAGATAHARALGEVLLFVLPAFIAPLLLFEYLVGLYHVHPLTIDGRYFPDGGFLFDLHVLWKAGHDVVTGHSPYPFIYPAPAALFMAPFGALPFKVAVVAFALVAAAAAVLALWLLDVRDWRCYGLALAWMPTTSTVTLGAFSTLLALGAAAAWRYRDRRFVVAIAIAAIVTTKVFLWPLFVWLVATRRFRTSITTAVTGVVLVVGCWAVIGFKGMLDYPHQLRSLAGSQEARSYSPTALMQSLGLSMHSAHVALAALAVLVVAAIFVVARTADGDRRAFVVALGAALVLSPIVWVHYLVLLYVVVALYRKRLGAAWIVPLAYWLLPSQDSHGSASIILRLYLITAVAVALAVSNRRPRPALVAARSR